MSEVLVAVASGKQHLIAGFVERVQALAPELPLIVLSEFAPAQGAWVPYRIERSADENLGRFEAERRGRAIRYCAFLDQPDTPYGPLRQLAGRIRSSRRIHFNENLDHFRWSVGSWKTILRHYKWRTRSWLRFQLRPGGRIYTLAWRLRHPHALERPLFYRLAKLRGARHKVGDRCAVPGLSPLPPGTAVVIPSRDGRELLARCLPPVLAQSPEQIIAVDNGSTDGTAEWLRREYPSVTVEVSAEPLSFAAAINRGLRHVSVSRVCLLNNDMEVEPGFFAGLHRVLDLDPQRFCATPEILFPEGQRREETGKAVWRSRVGPHEFPLACIDRVPGEDGSPVLYGSGGCSLYDTAKLRALGGLDESFVPAYVEDLDIGFRGWQHGWPTVFTPGARVLHRHRATTSRFYSERQIQSAVERNFLKFLLRTAKDENGFRKRWRTAIDRINRIATNDETAEQYLAVLRSASEEEAQARSSPAVIADDDILALGSGDIARFPGRQRCDGPHVLVASCYAPFPLSHGGAVRMYNLMRRAANEFRHTLVYFVDELHTPPSELLDLCIELIQVRRHGTHRYPRPDLPDVVQDFQSGPMAAMLRQLRPDIAQLEFTQLAQYADCFAKSKTLLVEHDVTIDLYRQLAATADGGNRWELDRQLGLWEKFEGKAWRECDRAIAMSERDRATIGARAEAIPNGVDTRRFSPWSDTPERGRLLFIGSFAHLPNLMAIEAFLREVWPQLDGASLHIVAGNRPEYYLDFYRERVKVDLSSPGIELEAFVSDVRPAYRRASVVIAPLIASAGTNIKILEAMAMGKAIVSTPAGVHGLDVTPDRDVVVCEIEEMAERIRGLIANPDRAAKLGQAARATVLERYDWDRIAEQQSALYRSLLAEMA